MLEQLGQEVINNLDKLEFSELEAGVPVLNGDIIFPRLNAEKEKKELEQIAMQNSIKTETKKENTITLIDIEDFSKVQLKTAKVLNCEKVENSDKLLKLTLKIKDETRTVLSGIAKYYEPKMLIDKTVVLVYNLKPAVIRGIESNGMILCAEDEKGNLSIITPEKDIVSGSTVR